MGEFFTYTPDQVIIEFDGTIIRGFAPDTFVEVERDEDGFMKLTGTLGDVARSRNLNYGGKITITLMAVSPTNDELSILAEEDEFEGDGYGSLFVKDLNGGTLCHAETAWVLKWPKIDRSKESGTITWVFDCADIEIDASGNVAR